MKYINKILSNCIAGGGSCNIQERRQTYYSGCLLSIFGAKEVQFRVPRDIS